MLKYRLLLESDRKIIENWPKYEAPFQKLDYGLRKGGWLDTIAEKKDCIKLAFENNNELVGFSLLDCTEGNSAEFYIAIKGTLLNQGFGKQICIETLKIAFENYSIDRVYLKVRVDHKVGIKLYQQVGYRYVKDWTEVVNNIETDFYYYEVHRE